MDPGAEYLRPYVAAAARHGSGFDAMLWASPATQAARFAAIVRAHALDGLSVLDVGCGRADLLDFLLAHDVIPADYVGIEAVPELAAAAEAKCPPWVPAVPVTIVRADFVAEPARMFVAADAVVVSGSLNTLDPDSFYATIRRAYDAATKAVVFNFLSSPMLAGRAYLHWHDPGRVLGFCRALRPAPAGVRALDDYLDGDTTVAVTKSLE